MISVVAPTWAAAGPGINAARRKTSGQTRRDLRLAAGRRTQNVRGGGISMGSRLQHRVQGTGRARGTSVRPRRALETPSGALPEERQGWPDDAVGIAPTLGSVEEIRELRDRGEAPARGSDRLPVALEDPRPLLRREPEEKGGQVIAERSDAHAIPIDEPCPRSCRRVLHEGVHSPEGAVEHGIRRPR